VQFLFEPAGVEALAGSLAPKNRLKAQLQLSSRLLDATGLALAFAALHFFGEGGGDLVSFK
jgi:hypothetical protein